MLGYGLEEMGTESNARFYGDEAFSSAMNYQGISFQSGPINNSSSEMIPIGGYFPLNHSPSSSSSGAMSFPGNFSSMVGTSQVMAHPASNSPPASLLLDSVPGLRQDVRTVDWSVDEQCKLERGLFQYANEPSMMRYIKIAALLHNKTIRDVAQRCRWMNRKRRKLEEHMSGKKVNKRKDKFVELPSKSNMTTATPLDMSRYPFMMNYYDQNRSVPFEGMTGPVEHLLEQNAYAFNQITANLSTYKLQDNIDLFYCTQNNITAILNDMRHMPGIMSQMLPLPVSINDELANYILHNSA